MPIGIKIKMINFSLSEPGHGEFKEAAGFCGGEIAIVRLSDMRDASLQTSANAIIYLAWRCGLSLVRNPRSFRGPRCEAWASVF